MRRILLFDVVVGAVLGIVAGGLLFLCMGVDVISALCGIVATLYFWAGFYSGNKYSQGREP